MDHRHVTERGREKRVGDATNRCHKYDCASIGWCKKNELCARSIGGHLGPFGRGQVDRDKTTFECLRDALGVERLGDDATATRNRTRRCRLPFCHDRGVCATDARRANFSNAARFSAVVIGTVRSNPKLTLASQRNKWVILEIDVEGAAKVTKVHPDVITIFVGLKSLDEIEQRLRARGTENDESIRRRLEVAAVELQRASSYQYFVINDSVDRAANEICQILKRCSETRGATDA